MIWAVTAAALVFMALSIPLILRRIPKNDFYGVRTPLTMSASDEDWYAANEKAGKVVFIGGLMTIIACVLLASWHHGKMLIGITSTALSIATLCGAFIVTSRKSNGSSKSQPDGGNALHRDQ